MLFSIIVVSLNPGKRLFETVESIQQQTFSDYEIVIKDGMSSDGSIEKLEVSSNMNVIQTKDSSIYDGMNQGIGYAKGKYLLFLNCGDKFYDNKVLENVARALGKNKFPDLVYGNLFNELLGTQIESAPFINGFTCYRNVPCHQTCFYSRKLFEQRKYNVDYVVRGDYEHFLWCYYKEHAEIIHIPVVISFYEGGGFSETPNNIRRSKREHKEITKIYMSFWSRICYKGILLITLAPLRRVVAQSKHLSKCYNKIKQIIYRRKRT